MPDALLAQLTEEIGVNIGNITVANGFVNEVKTVAYDTLEDVVHATGTPANFPRVEILVLRNTTTDISNERQVMTADFQIVGHLLKTDYTDDLASRKAFLEFAADIRTAILDIYDRLKSGAFVMPEFVIVMPINQFLFSTETPSELISVSTDVQIQVDATFDQR